MRSLESAQGNVFPGFGQTAKELNMDNENNVVTVSSNDEKCTKVWSDGEKQILSMITQKEDPLPYPLRDVEVGNGTIEREYEIPDSKRKEVLNGLYPFVPCPKMDDVMYDLHCRKPFKVREYRVIRWDGRNYLVTPYYPTSGGMVVDWIDEKSYLEENENGTVIARAISKKGNEAAK